MNFTAIKKNYKEIGTILWLLPIYREGSEAWEVKWLISQGPGPGFESSVSEMQVPFSLVTVSLTPLHTTFLYGAASAGQFAENKWQVTWELSLGEGRPRLWGSPPGTLVCCSCFQLCVCPVDDHEQGPAVVCVVKERKPHTTGAGAGRGNPARPWAPPTPPPVLGLEPPGAGLLVSSTLMWDVGFHIICYNGLTSFPPNSLLGFFFFNIFTESKESCLSGSEQSVSGGRGEKQMISWASRKVHNLRWVLYTTGFQTVVCDPLADHESKSVGHDQHFLILRRIVQNRKYQSTSHVTSVIYPAKLPFQLQLCTCMCIYCRLDIK